MEENKKWIDFAIRSASLSVILIIGVFFLGEGVPYVIGTIIISLVTNYIWDEIKKRRAK